MGALCFRFLLAALIYILTQRCSQVNSEGEDAIILLSSRKSVNVYSLARKQYSIISESEYAVGVAYDGNYVYWTDLMDENESIIRSHLNGTNKEILVKTGIGAPEDLAVDWLTGNIYFTDSKFQHIGICSNDGMHCCVIIQKSIDQPRAIVLNPSKGEMYWTDWGMRPEIAKADMDGYNDVSLILSNIEWPNGLTLDTPNDRLYWVDGKHSWIDSVRTDGSQRKRVLQNIGHPHWVSVFEDSLYWTDWESNSLQKCNKFTGKGRKVLINEKKIYGIHVCHPVMLSNKSHPCQNSSCSHLCLLKPNNKFSCACPEGSVLAADMMNCEENVYNHKLIIGVKNMLLTLHHPLIGRHHIVNITLPVEEIGFILHDSVKDCFIIYDELERKIYSVENYDKIDPKVTELVDNVEQIEGMDFDYVTNTLYWCNAYKQTLEVFSLTTLTRTTLIKEMNGNVIINIALVPEYGCMFLAMKTKNGDIHIYRMSMDGEGPLMPIIQHGIKGPTVKLQYDSATLLLYIVDSEGKKIESVFIDGTKRQSYRILQSMPGSLSLLNKDIFWANKHSSTIFWSPKNDGSGQMRSTKLNLPFSVLQLHLATALVPKNRHHECSSNSTCSHICLQAQTQIPYTKSVAVQCKKETYTCFCPEGMLLNFDNKTCNNEVECSFETFKCKKSKICIHKTKICDGKYDCVFGEDEAGCTSKSPKCLSNQFQCLNGKCIDIKKKCDKNIDCSDNSDEEECGTNGKKQTCKKSQYQCMSGDCIDKTLLCDDITHCPDSDDEKNCEKTMCEASSFQCRSGTCIPKPWECDGHIDCIDGSDEHNKCLRSPTCAHGMFRCHSGKCLDPHLFCNDKNDCGDWSDEYDCTTDAVDEKEVKECLDIEYSCTKSPSICLPYTARCNGKKDCPDGEDEFDCDADDRRNCEHQNEWECHSDGKCIPLAWVCDQSKDCIDGSDENNERCNVNKGNSTKIPIIEPTIYTPIERVPCEGGYVCENGQCIDYNLVCDGFKNCLDRSDEGRFCNVACNENNCEYRCIKTPSGGICICGVGEQLSSDNQTCIAKQSACHENPSPCHHICTDSKGSYFCGCFDGYSLKADRKSCKANGKPMHIIFPASNELVKFSPHENTITKIHETNKLKISGLDVYLKNKTIVYSINETAEIRLLDYITNKEIILSNLGNPTLVSVDWIVGNIYFVNKGINTTIDVCRIDKQVCGTIFAVETKNVSAIIVDPINRVIFFVTTIRSNDASKSVIWKKNLDGSGDTKIIDSNLSYCTGLAIDYEKKLLYFSDQQRNVIESVNYEGNLRKILVIQNLSAAQIYGLDIFEDEIFFAISEASKIMRCKIFGSIACNYYHLGSKKIEMFKIFQSNKQKNVKNACTTTNCTSICIQTTSNAKCLCPDGKYINESQSCDKNQTQYILNLKENMDVEILRNRGICESAHYIILAILINFIVYIFSKKIYRFWKKRAHDNIRHPRVHFRNPVATVVGDHPEFTMNSGNITSRSPILIMSNLTDRVNLINPESDPTE